ncbi:hypothetical protein [Burkholderia plantarii]|uniref:hypothetical protein n=1 Tax=Burkholderia plantarii TaxID=41899 RepID=UPI0011DF9A04|nr:hypothetical protein [Burkholderia plantarii]GLZ16848.1 hypothetical protein Bpla01_03780 [Burkholderia plantarii]
MDISFRSLNSRKEIRVYSPRFLLPLVMSLATLGIFLTVPVSAQQSEQANVARETTALSSQQGKWIVVETFWVRPDAPPVVTKGLVAERRMVGRLLEERLYAVNSREPVRIDYLGYDAIAGQWCYVSIDTRVPVPPMSASSFERDTPDRITLRFEPFAAPPIVPEWSGRLLRMEQVIARKGLDHETKDQYFILADGSGTRWLAHRYDYQRER